MQSACAFANLKGLAYIFFIFDIYLNKRRTLGWMTEGRISSPGIFNNFIFSKSGIHPLFY